MICRCRLYQLLWLLSGRGDYISFAHSADNSKIANIEKKVPLEWITEDGTNVSEELVNYIRPLIQAELTPIMITGQPRHIVIDRQ